MKNIINAIPQTPEEWERKWRARDDAEALRRAIEVKKDPERMQDAKAELFKSREELKEKLDEADKALKSFGRTDYKSDNPAKIKNL